MKSMPSNTIRKTHHLVRELTTHELTQLRGGSIDNPGQSPGVQGPNPGMAAPNNFEIQILIGG